MPTRAARKHTDPMAGEISRTGIEIKLAWHVINARRVKAFRCRPVKLVRMKLTGCIMLRPHSLPSHLRPLCPAELDREKIRYECSAGSLHLPPLSLKFRPLHLPSHWLLLKMPRRRGTSRRGGSSAPRGKPRLSASECHPYNLCFAAPSSSLSNSSSPEQRFSNFQIYVSQSAE